MAHERTLWGIFLLEGKTAVLFPILEFGQALQCALFGSNLKALLFTL